MTLLNKNKKGLKYQTLLDSVQGRGPSLMFLPYVSNPELEGCIVTWDFFETIHSRSYTHIMKNVYSDPSEVFDTILDDKEILKRAKSTPRHEVTNKQIFVAPWSLGPGSCGRHIPLVGKHRNRI